MPPAWLSNTVVLRCDLLFDHIFPSRWQSIICPVRQTASLGLSCCSVGYVFVSWCVGMLMRACFCVCECLPLSLALMIDNVLRFLLPLPSLIDPPVSDLSQGLPHIINSRTLSRWTVTPSHVPYGLSGILYLAGGWIECVSVRVHSCISLFKRAKRPYGVERWGKSVCCSQISGRLGIRYQRNVCLPPKITHTLTQG